MKTSHILASRNRKTLVLFLLLLTVMTLLSLPARAVGATSLTQTGSYAPCAQDTAGGSADWTNCLPSGRWGRSVGVIMTRSEQATGLFSPIQNLGSSISTTMRLMLPNMLLTICQVMWSAALGMSQFAASFTPLDAMGQSVDHAAGQLADQVMAGSLPAWFLVIGLCAGLWVMVFRNQQEGRTILRRSLVGVLCIAVIIIMGGAASRSTANGPATGSPWWLVKTVNDTVNSMSVGLNMDGINDDPSMMSYSGGKDGNCQKYLYQMGRQYSGANGGPGAPASQSNVVTAIDRLWQETALRSYVTMQWGNPKTGGPSNQHVADNAMQAYCHVLEASAGTPVGIQKDLTNQTMGTDINDRTAQYLFSTRGWITTTDTSVNSSDKAKDSDETTKLNRMGVFWETCTADQGQIHSRGGWNKLINNLSDSGSGAIKGAGKDNVLRIPLGGSSGDNWNKIAPSNDSRIMIASNQDYTGAVNQLCNHVFNNQVWNNYNGNTPKEPTGPDGDKNYVDTNLGDSASMGWRFDVPNSGSTWREANMYNEDPTTVNGSVATTLGYFYGTSSIDTTGAIGSVIGSFVNLLVWGLFSFLLILSKTMLLLMALLLIPALLAQSFPIGEGIRHSVKNWFTFTINLSAIDIVYNILATIATFICQTILRAIAAGSGTFFYQILAGISPVLSLIIISLFCSKVLHIGNPFSLQSLFKVAGAGALGAGVVRLLKHGASMSMYRRVFGRGRGRGRRMGLGTRSRIGSGTESSTIAETASRQQLDLSNSMPGDQPTRLHGVPTFGVQGPQGKLSDSRSPSDSSHGLHSPNSGSSSANMLRVPLRTHARGMVKGAVKLGAVGAGMAALSMAGGSTLALPAGIALAGTVAKRAVHKGMVFHQDAQPLVPPVNPVVAGPSSSPSVMGQSPHSGGLSSGQVADDAAREQSLAMGLHPTTDHVPGDSTSVTGSVFDSPRTSKPVVKPLVHEPKPVWDDANPAKSRQAYAAWAQREREITAHLLEAEQMERQQDSGVEGGI